MNGDDEDNPSFRPENLLLVAFATTLAWAPFPYGSNRFWAELLLGAGLGAILLAWSFLALTGRATTTSLTRKLFLPFVCVIAAFSWAFAQSLDLAAISRLTHFDVTALGHPIWSMTATALGTRAQSYVSVDPELTRHAIFAGMLSVAAFLIAFELGRERTRAAMLLAAIVFIAVAYAAMAFANLYLHVDFQSWLMPDPKLATDRLSGPFVNPNHLATFAAMGSLAALGMFVETVRQSVVWDRGFRVLFRTLVQALTGAAVLWLAATVALISTVLLTQSRGGVIAFLIGLVALLVALAIGRRMMGNEAPGRRATVAFLVLVLGVATAISADPILGRVQEQGLGDTARASLAQSTLQAIQTAPLVGHGFGAFERYYPLFADGSVLGDVDEAHNDILETLADLGLPAGLAYMAAPALLAGMCFAGCVRRRRDRVYPAVAFAASMVVGAHAFVEFGLQIPAVAITYAALLGTGAAQSWRTGSDSVR
jgi:O-antigen ligase